MTMTEEEKPQEPAASTEAWGEVGQQFQALGESLAVAFRTLWEREENRQHVEQIRSGLEGMAKEVSQAVKQAGDTAEGQRVKEQAKKVAESAQKASKQAFDEARPHLLSALRQMNTELQKVIEQWETPPAAEPAAGEAEETPTAPPEETPAE
jgi:ElaB/YqjD/DUF883 family membrane-anchored ribosome-binding protein